MYVGMARLFKSNVAEIFSEKSSRFCRAKWRGQIQVLKCKIAVSGDKTKK
jgi:hypothetical protein